MQEKDPARPVAPDGHVEDRDSGTRRGRAKARPNTARRRRAALSTAHGKPTVQRKMLPSRPAWDRFGRRFKRSRQKQRCRAEARRYIKFSERQLGAAVKIEGPLERGVA